MQNIQLSHNVLNIYTGRPAIWSTITVGTNQSKYQSRVILIFQCDNNYLTIAILTDLVDFD